MVSQAKVMTSSSLSAPIIAREVLDSPSSVIPLYEVAYEQLVNHGLAETQALDEMDHLQQAIVREIDRLFAEYEAKKLESPFEWVDRTKGTLVRSGRQVGSTVGPLGQRDSILAALLTLTWRQFEFLCGALLVEYGLDDKKVIVGRGSNEGGVDFVALLDPPARGPLNRVHRTPFRLLGQAKKYKGEVSFDAVQAFCGRVEEVRFGGGKAWGLLPEWFRTVQVPILGILMTTGMFGPSARKAAREHVVLLFDGLQLADDLRKTSLSSAWFDEQGQFNLEAFQETCAALSDD